MPAYEIMLSTGKVVTWDGKDGEDACTRYVAAHPDTKAVAFREADRHGIHYGLLPIQEA